MVSTEPQLDREASWAEYSSTKFLFFGHLIDIASTRDLHLIIAAQDDRKQNLIERYLLGKGFSYTRSRDEMGGAVEVSLMKDSLSFGIHSNDNVRDLYKAPSAIFVLDSTFNPKAPSIEYIRTTYTRNGGPLPVIWLLISNTCEHIQRCLPDASESEQLRILLQYTARLHYDVGDLQEDALGVHESAEEILNYLVEPSTVAWPLAMIEPLHGAAEMDDSTPPSEESQVATQKRSLVCTNLLTDLSLVIEVLIFFISPMTVKRITQRSARESALKAFLCRQRRNRLSLSQEDLATISYCN